MDALFRRHGIYSHVGQLYEPVDRKSLLYYKESQDGQVIEEGITEAGAMSSFIAAGTSYANLGVNMIPFYTFYSMFGFQRVGDLIWAAADSRAKGFLLGATAGRTTLAGEGLQHQDGHSHIHAATVPNVQAWDPAYAYELAVIIKDGLRRMYRDNEVWIYYLTLYNENYPMPSMPKGVEEGILKGLYRFAKAPGKAARNRPQILGSGPLLNEALRAQAMLQERYDVASDVWSVPSYKQLRREALEVDRWNRLHPGSKTRRSYVEECFAGEEGPFIAVSDYMRLVPDQVARWIPGSYSILGTDGFGRSDTRDALRRHFEVNAEHVAYAVLVALWSEGRLDARVLKRAQKELHIDPDKPDPLLA
jgi:pyruvate dehydrogenase E1 component